MPPANIPHAFLLDLLYPLPVRTQPMFGNVSFYVGEKIYFSTRSRADKPADNGIWVGTTVDHHESLRAEFPSLTTLNNYRIKSWLLLPETAEDFEESARALCLAVMAEDPRIGVTPKPKKNRPKKK